MKEQNDKIAIEHIELLREINDKVKDTNESYVHLMKNQNLLHDKVSMYIDKRFADFKMATEAKLENFNTRLVAIENKIK